MDRTASIAVGRLGLVAAIAATLCAPAPRAAPADDWKSRRAELARAITADNDRATRENALTVIAGFPGAEPTRMLLSALDETVAEQEALQKRFDDLTIELQDVLLGRMDVRLAPPKTKEQVEERRAIGERMTLEAALDDHVLSLLTKRKDDESAALLLSLVNKPSDWKTKTRLIEVAGKLGRPEAMKELHAALRDKDARVRIVAAQACSDLGQAESAPFVASMLGDKEWPVKAAAVEALGVLQNKVTVPALVAALGQETGRLREELAAVLEAMTGQSLGTDARAWLDWWERSREQFLAEGVTVAVPSQAKPSIDPFSYYGIKTHSDKVIFVLDISDSMNDDPAETVVPEDGIPKRVGNLRTKIQIARDQLAQTIVELPPEATFGIITYNKYVKAWQPRLVPANKRNKNEALTFVLGIEASDATNIFDALELALSLGGRGVGDKWYASQVDTIFFLTDGKPTDGRIQDTAKILEEIRRINKFGKVKIHTIGAGYLHDRPFLEQLAAENGGKYVNIQ